MTRFFIDLNDAAKFVCDSFKLMDKGEIFIPKMYSMLIKDLVQCIFPNCKLKKIGLRPVEKIDEVLISENEITDKYKIKNVYFLITKKFY